MPRKKCKCGIMIHWIGKLPVETENYFTVVSEFGEIASGYVSHFECCPHADEFRSKRAPIQSEGTIPLPGFDSDAPSSEAYRRRLKDEQKS